MTNMKFLTTRKNILSFQRWEKTSIQIREFQPLLTGRKRIKREREREREEVVKVSDCRVRTEIERYQKRIFIKESAGQLSLNSING